MIGSISWKEFIAFVLIVVTIYYGCIGWMYRKDLLRWLRGDKNLSE